MIDNSHIFALSDSGFVRQQLLTVFCGAGCNSRGDSFWRGWGFDRKA